MGQVDARRGALTELRAKAVEACLKIAEEAGHTGREAA